MGLWGCISLLVIGIPLPTSDLCPIAQMCTDTLATNLLQEVFYRDIRYRKHCTVASGVYFTRGIYFGIRKTVVGTAVLEPIKKTNCKRPPLNVVGIFFMLFARIHPYMHYHSNFRSRVGWSASGKTRINYPYITNLSLLQYRRYLDQIC